MMIRFVISLIFSIIVAVFALQNATSVTIKFFFAEFTISQALIILISAVFGAIIVLFLGTIKQFKTNMKLKSLTKLSTELEEENKVLVEENTVLKEQMELSNIGLNQIEESKVDIDSENEDELMQ